MRRCTAWAAAAHGTSPTPYACLSVTYADKRLPSSLRRFAQRAEYNATMGIGVAGPSPICGALGVAIALGGAIRAPIFPLSVAIP